MVMRRNPSMEVGSGDPMRSWACFSSAKHVLVFQNFFFPISLQLMYQGSF